MPSGVYIRSEEQKEILRKNFEKATKISSKLPMTKVQREARRDNAYKSHKLPRTKKQREASSVNARKMGLNNNMDTIVEHHNDLCHGAERPNDITYMRASEHNSLHAKIQCQERDDKGRFK